MHPDLVFDRGLLRSAVFRRTHPDVRPLTTAVRQGEIIPLRRGAFVDAAQWAAASDRERHLLRARAVIADAEAEPVLASYSAAAAWGMPVLEFPEHVTLQEPWRGGGRSAPGVRRVSAGHPFVSIHRVGEFDATSVARTALEITRTEPFARALGSMDWALWRRNGLRVSREEVAAELARLPQRFGVERARRVVGFATDLSDSYGESWYRGLVCELGFELPELQKTFHVRGRTYRCDYWWRSVEVAGEFDGKGKYLRSLAPGDDPGKVVWREKRREDALRTVVRGMIRPVWTDLFDPDRVARDLLAAGIPRLGPSRRLR